MMMLNRIEVTEDIGKSRYHVVVVSGSLHFLSSGDYEVKVSLSSLVTATNCFAPTFQVFPLTFLRKNFFIHFQ